MKMDLLPWKCHDAAEAILVAWMKTESSLLEVPMNGGFWRRQFFCAATVGQKCLDAGFGIVVPLLCVWFDPMVFRENGFLPGWKIYAYAEITTGVLALGCVLITQRASVWWCGVLAGTGIFALLLGVVMLPLSLLGLFAAGAVEGVLSLAPFIAGFVLLRNAIRCSRSLEPRFAARVACIAIATVVLPCIPDALAHLMSGPSPQGS